MLSGKRCGSTAMFRLFQKHPDVGVCHHDPTIRNWEPNFWNLAADAIDGSPQAFVERFRESHPFLKPPGRFTQDAVFDLWGQLLSTLGPVVFDKTPKYLGHRKGMELLYAYAAAGNDVRLFAMVRDPRDMISSQYELWKDDFPPGTPEYRERHWLDQYRHLEALQAGVLPIPLFRYEDFAASPSRYVPQLMKHLGLRYDPEVHSHIRPTSIGRYSLSTDPEIRRWRYGAEFAARLRQYGYPKPQYPWIVRVAKRGMRRIRRIRGGRGR